MRRPRDIRVLGLQGFPVLGLRGFPVLGLGLLLLPVGLVACAPENPQFLRDSTRLEVEWSCDRGCTVEGASAAPPVCGDATEFQVGAGALAILCALDPAPTGDVVHERTCRPVLCFEDRDCPQFSGRGYVCFEGVCEADALADVVLDALDVTALCLADLPRSATCAEAESDPVVAERLALVEASCPAPGARCAVPEACLP